MLSLCAILVVGYFVDGCVTVLFGLLLFNAAGVTMASTGGCCFVFSHAVVVEFWLPSDEAISVSAISPCCFTTTRWNSFFAGTGSPTTRSTASSEDTCLGSCRLLRPHPSTKPLEMRGGAWRRESKGPRRLGSAPQGELSSSAYVVPGIAFISYTCGPIGVRFLFAARSSHTVPQLVRSLVRSPFLAAPLVRGQLRRFFCRFGVKETEPFAPLKPWLRA